MEVEIKTEEDLKNILLNITFNPSCVDMDWAWKIRRIYFDHPLYWGTTTGEPFPGVTKRTVVDGGWLISTTFKRPDRTTGQISVGQGREWFVPLGSTMTSVVKTAFAACKMILEHELMESFKFDGQRPFDPHNTIVELMSLQFGKSNERHT